MAITTSRTILETLEPRRSEEVAACLATSRPWGHQRVLKSLPLHRNREFLDVQASTLAWWGCLPQVTPPGVITCSACGRRAPIKVQPCPQCSADICEACTKEGDPQECPSCGSWYLEVYPFQWGVPWDMPRPAPTRCEAVAPATPAPAVALPQRMAAATGPGGWLRLPPQHQQMHPVDVLVDGVLGALDGNMLITPGLPYLAFDQRNSVSFERAALSDRFRDEGEFVDLEGARRRLKQAVDRLMRQAAGAGLFQEVRLEVRRVLPPLVRSAWSLRLPATATRRA